MGPLREVSLGVIDFADRGTHMNYLQGHVDVCPPYCGDLPVNGAVTWSGFNLIEYVSMCGTGRGSLHR